MLYCTSKSCKIQVATFRLPKWRLNENFSRQREKASHIGDHIGRNFKPCSKQPVNLDDQDPRLFAVAGILVNYNFAQCSLAVAACAGVLVLLHVNGVLDS